MTDAEESEFISYAQSFETRYGRITTPGTFKGLPSFAPYFHAQWERGLADREIDPTTALFMIGDGETTAFPDLSGCTAVIVYDDDAGRPQAFAFDHLVVHA